MLHIRIISNGSYFRKVKLYLLTSLNPFLASHGTCFSRATLASSFPALETRHEGHPRSSKITAKSSGIGSGPKFWRPKGCEILTQIRAKILDTMAKWTSNNSVEWEIHWVRHTESDSNSLHSGETDRRLPVSRRNGPMFPILCIHQHQPTPGVPPLHRPAVIRSGPLRQWPSTAFQVFHPHKTHRKH